MRKSRFSDEQIIAILREQEAGRPTAEVCRKHRDQRRDILYLSMDGSPGASDLSSFPANLGANIYPASPGMLARPNGYSARREPQQVGGFDEPL